MVVGILSNFFLVLILFRCSVFSATTTVNLAMKFTELPRSQSGTIIPMSDVFKILETTKPEFYLISKSYVSLAELLGQALKNATPVVRQYNAFQHRKNDLERNYSTVEEALWNGQVDIYLGMIRTTQERMETMDFLWTLGEITGEITLKKETAFGNVDVFTSRWRSAGMISAIGIFISACIALVTWKRSLAWDIWFWSCSFVAQQGSAENMIEVRGGMKLVSLGAFMSMIALSIYTANLASDIAIPKIKIASTKDLFNQGFKYVSQDYGWVHNYLCDNDPYIHKIVSDPNRVIVFRQHSYKIFQKTILNNKDNDLLFMIGSSSAGNRRLRITGFPVEKVLRVPIQKKEGNHYGLALPFGKTSKNKKPIVDALLKLQESGLFIRIQDNMMGVSSWKVNYASSMPFVPASLVQVASAFWVWSFGVALALGIFALEWIHFKMAGKKLMMRKQQGKAASLVQKCGCRCHGEVSIPSVINLHSVR